MNLQDQIYNMKDKKQEIIDYIKGEEYDIALNLCYEYKKKYEYDLDIITITAEVKIVQEKYDEAEELLEGILSKYEYNFEVNCLLGIINFYKRCFFKALKYFYSCFIIDRNRIGEFENILELIIISDVDEKKILDEVRLKFINIDRLYPLCDSENNICEFSNPYVFNGETYYKGIYDYYYSERDGLFGNIPNKYYQLIKTELIPGKKTNKYEYEAKNDSVIPLMKINKENKLIFKYEKEEYSLDINKKNRYYYYRVNKGEKVNINCETDFVVGNPISLNINEDKPKIILNIFIDGLSQIIIEENGLEKLMPNTSEFFKKGTICNNAYVCGEWTYVSLATFFTGLYTTNHRVFNPNYNTDNIKNKKIYSEIFRENNYNTAKIDGDWRSNPQMGYAKGFNRYLYQPSVRGMHCDDVINETIEHLEAFRETNNFVWICLPDLHDIADEYETRLSTKIKSAINIRPLVKNSETSVHKKYDETKIERYKIQLARIDTYLNILYNYITEKYGDDEFIVSLVSDHGQGYFIKENEEMLEQKRIKVPLMLRGKNIPNGECLEMVQSMDLFPIILSAIGIEDFKDRDGIVPKYFGGSIERSYAISETFFPETPYRATINDKVHKFFFETEGLCGVDGRFVLGNFKTKLINKKNNTDESKENIDKLNRYIDIIIDHIKEYIIY